MIAIQNINGQALTLAIKHLGAKLPRKVRDHLYEIIKHVAYMAGGEPEVKMEITADGEIGRLRQIFNEMVLNVKLMEKALIEKDEKLEEEISERERVEKALQKAHDELETRVKERTAGLPEANLVLQIEITELKNAVEQIRMQSTFLEVKNKVFLEALRGVNLDELLVKKSGVDL